MSPVVQGRLWRTRAVSGRRHGRKPGRVPRASESVKAIDRGLRAVDEREFPDLWADLSGEGRDMFVRGLIEAASRPPDDRDEAVAEVIETWHQAHILLYAPVDDEPYTDEERAEDDAALERLGLGEGIPLDDLLPRSRRDS